MDKFRRVLVAFAALALAAVSPLRAAYVEPQTRNNGDNITVSIWNQDVVDNVKAIYALVGSTSAFVQTLLDDADAATFRTTLGIQSTFQPTTDANVTIQAGATNRDVNLTPTGTGRIIADKAIKLFGTTSDPANAQDISYDTTDGVAQAKYAIGVVKIPGTFHQVNGSTTYTADGTTTALTEASFSLPASTNQDGMTIDFEFFGTHSTGGGTASQVRFGIYKGSTEIVKNTLITLPSSTTGFWHVKGQISGRSTSSAAAAITAFVSSSGGLSQLHDTVSGVVTFSSTAETLTFTVYATNPGSGSTTISLDGGSWVKR